MKGYESAAKVVLPGKSYIIARIDGRAFHTYTKGLKRPFDEGLMQDMDLTAQHLCRHIQNAKLAYVQSDEISVLMYESDRDSQPWFKNSLQKMASVSAAMATAEFNKHRMIRAGREISGLHGMTGLTLQEIMKFKMAEFDARFWLLPNTMEVYNYFLWRQMDATKNSISSAAQFHYSSNQLDKKNSTMKLQMLLEAEDDWEKQPAGAKYGRIITKETYVDGVNLKKIPHQEIPLGVAYDGESMVKQKVSIRSKWEASPAFSFKNERERLFQMIPSNQINFL